MKHKLFKFSAKSKIPKEPTVKELKEIITCVNDKNHKINIRVDNMEFVAKGTDEHVKKVISISCQKCSVSEYLFITKQEVINWNVS